jgi:hypothetical protein
MRHPRELGVGDVEAFLCVLANERKVSPSQNQANSGCVDHGRYSWLIGANER